MNGSVCACAGMANCKISHPQFNAGGPLDAKICPECGRLELTDGRARIFMRHVFRSLPKHPGVASGKLSKALCDALDEYWDMSKSNLSKSLSSGCWSDPASCGLRWVTFHPNGEQPGQPMLVHDNGEEYTVVGGAGGKLNQTVFKRPKGADDAEGKSARLKRQEERKATAAKMQEDAPEHVAKAKMLDEKAKSDLSDLQQELLKKVGGSVGGDLIEGIKKEAMKAAAKLKPNATAAEKQEFAHQAEKHGKNEANKAALKVLEQLLDHDAMRQLGEGDDSPAQVSVKLAGQTLLKKFSKEEIDDVLQRASDAGQLKAKANAIRRALKSGNQDTIQGIHADIKPLPAAEASKQNLDRYLKGLEVDANTNLVKSSEQASTLTQRRNQANGAADAINAVVGTTAQKAILTPQATRILGVENAGRVAADYLAKNGHDAQSKAGELRERIAQDSYASIGAAFAKVKDMDDLVDSAYDAAKAGDGSYSKVEAGALKSRLTQRKFTLLNTARGQLRGAAAMAFALEHPSKQPMEIAAGDTAVGAAVKAKQLGLQQGDYTIKKASGGYNINVEPEKVHLLATEHDVAQSDRNVAMDKLKQDVESNPGDWRAYGQNPNIKLAPEQELATRAIVDQKRIALNYQAGSGKTPIAYTAISQLLHDKTIDKALITMPAKPRSQQNDDKDGKPGEISKFLTPEMAKTVGVVADGADLVKKLKQIKDGTLKTLVMSPQLMRDKLEDLKAAGFGGDKSAYFADEAHEFAIGGKDGKGSHMAQAARELSKSTVFVPMSGTLIENDASELHSVLDMVHPGSLGSQKDFTTEYQRLAQGNDNLFANEGLSSMRDRLSGSMLTYHKPLMREDGAGGHEPVGLEKNIVTVPVSEGQKKAIAKVTAQFNKDKVHDDATIRAGASLKRYGAIKRILSTGADNPKMQAIKAIQDQERLRDPKNRVGVYGSEIKMLDQAQKTLGGKSVRITGGEDDTQTKRSVDAINNRENDTQGVVLSNAANYGINLTGMDHLIKLHPSDVPSKEDQLDHRHHRKGQTRDVRTTTLVSDHPVEKMAQFRNQQIKSPELHLLAKLGDDSHRSAILAKHHADIEKAAA